MILKIDSLVNECLKQLYQTIFTYCKESATGTLFLVTAENRSGQVVFHQGALLGLSYGGESNERALIGLLEQPSLRQSFTDNLIFPLSETLLPEDSIALLEAMGMMASQGYEDIEVIEHPETIVENAAETITKPKTQRIYRGQVVK